jgi:hypothetical protein
MSQIDHAAEQFFATTCRDRMNRYEQRLYDHYTRQREAAEAQQLNAHLAAYMNTKRKRAS